MFTTDIYTEWVRKEGLKQRREIPTCQIAGYPSFRRIVHMESFEKLYISILKFFYPDTCMHKDLRPVL